jgi:glucan phosphoethanolaminetransferase (alkaline phosphatase superfamily)
MPRWNPERIAPASGLAAIVLLLISTFLPGTPPKIAAASPKIVHYFASHHRSGLVASVLGALGVIAVLWFIGTLASAIRRSGEDRLGPIALAGGVAAVAFVAVGGIISTALFFDVAKTSPGLAKPLYQTGTIATTLVGFPTAVLIAAAAIASFRRGLFPRWYAGGSGLAALVVVFSGAALAHKGFYSPTGAYAIIAFIVFLVWIAVTSGLLILQAEPAQAPAAQTPAT